MTNNISSNVVQAGSSVNLSQVAHSRDFKTETLVKSYHFVTSDSANPRETYSHHTWLTIATFLLLPLR